MATHQWSNLPSDILNVILKALNTDIDTLRLRSVCSAWRSSTPKLQKPLSFPLKLPLLIPPDLDIKWPRPTSDYSCTLHESTVYRLSPPTSAGDPSKGWLFRVSQTPNPNTFSLLGVLDTHTDENRLYSPLCTPPKQLNLVDYRISEVCKSYSLTFSPLIMWRVRKVIPLWNYLPDCDFAALALWHSGGLCYWRFGDDDWTPIDTNGYHFHDMIVWEGVCYAVDSEGVLVSFDSQLNQTSISTSLWYLPLLVKESFLVGCNSELCLISKIEQPDIDFDDADAVQFELLVGKFSKQNGCWESLGAGLRDRVFILAFGASVCFSAEDFSGCKGGTVYLTDYDFVDQSEWLAFAGVYHLEEGRAFVLAKAEDVAKIFLPPAWLA